MDKVEFFRIFEKTTGIECDDQNTGKSISRLNIDSLEYIEFIYQVENASGVLLDMDKLSNEMTLNELFALYQESGSN